MTRTTPLLRQATFTGCQFTANTASWTGGGVFISNTSPSFNGCTFKLNTAIMPGGEVGGGGSSSVDQRNRHWSTAPSSGNTDYSRQRRWTRLLHYTQATVTNCDSVSSRQ